MQKSTETYWAAFYVNHDNVTYFDSFFELNIFPKII